MSNFPLNFLKQKCVYFEPNGSDGYGGTVFKDGVELACRWSDSTELITDGKGQQITSRAIVMLAQDVLEGGYLFLGTLDDLDSAQMDDPMSVEGGYMIRRFDRVPTVKATAFIRAAFL